MAGRLTKAKEFLVRPKPLRIGSEAPDFNAKSTPYTVNGENFPGGDFNFYSYVGGNWAVLFSHPCDFTPVCTTEIASFAEKQDEFHRRDTRLIGLSINNVQRHKTWVSEIESNILQNCRINFPIIADNGGVVSGKYDMIDKDQVLSDEDISECEKKMHTIRSVFIINPEKKVRAILSYPMETGRNIDEIIRMIDSLQAHYDTGENIVTPANWQPGNNVLFRPRDLKKITELFSDVIDSKLPYMKFKPLAKSQIKGFRQDPLRQSFSELGIRSPTRPSESRSSS